MNDQNQPGKSVQRLTDSSPAGMAIRQSVILQWREHGKNIAKWKAPMVVFTEHEQLMGPYGSNDRTRKDKHRSNYNRQIRAQFELGGKLFYIVYYQMS